MKEAPEIIINNFEQERDPDMPPAEILRPDEKIEEITEKDMVR